MDVCFCFQSSDTTGYDEYVEGVEPEETMSLETHIGEVGVALVLDPNSSRLTYDYNYIEKSEMDNI